MGPPPQTSPPSLTRGSLPCEGLNILAGEGPCHRLDSPTKHRFGDWVAESWTWDWFFTGTFAPLDDEERPRRVRNRIGWSASDRAWRTWVRQREESFHVADGVMVRDSPTGLWWIRAREPHQVRESTHFHALVGGVGNLSRKAAWEDWFRTNGQCRVDPVRSSEAVGLYVAKYVLKGDGEIVFSEGLETWKR